MNSFYIKPCINVYSKLSGGVGKKVLLRACFPPRFHLPHSYAVLTLLRKTECISYHQHRDLRLFLCRLSAHPFLFAMLDRAVLVNKRQGRQSCKESLSSDSSFLRTYSFFNQPYHSYQFHFIAWRIASRFFVFIFPKLRKKNSLSV